MNSRTTLLLALIALVITPLAYQAVRDARPSYVVGDARPFSFAIPAVVSLEIARGEERIRIEKSAVGWDITAPVMDRGRYASIEDLLHLLRDLCRCISIEGRLIDERLFSHEDLLNSL